MENTFQPSIPSQNLDSETEAEILSSHRLKLIKTILVVAVTLLLALAGFTGYYFGARNAQQAGQSPPAELKPSTSPDEGVACTMDALICPDGSAVGRSGPNCEFSPCPTSTKREDTSQWQSYSNSTYGFNFKYPADWKVKDLHNANRQMYPNTLLWLGLAPKTVNEDVLGTLEVSKLSVLAKTEEFKRIYGTSPYRIEERQRDDAIPGKVVTELSLMITEGLIQSTEWIFDHKGATFQVSAGSADSDVLTQIARTLILER